MNSAALATALLALAPLAARAGIDGIVSGSADSGYSFLKIVPDAALGGMGEAGVALDHGVFSALLNPAALPTDRRTTFGLSNNDWIADASMVSAAGSFATGPVWLTLHARVLELDGFELRDTPNPDPDGEYSLQDVAAGINGAMEIAPGLSVGAGVSLVHEKIYRDDSRTASFGTGVLWTRGPWSAGLALNHLGAAGDLAGESVNLPRRITVGAGWSGSLPRVETPVRVAADWLATRDEDGHLHLGAELQPLDPLLLRAGWMQGYEDRSFSWGFGLRWRKFRLDYANLPFKRDFDDTQKFTFSFFM
ncbi:MAG: PorV/PorQ family protein [Calditrichaeota bacterium]|nr:PorV/PorQ family protein [Candidatus Cloacimonadota bacterium]MCB1046305.1 PorV/PorQ family protein [Calditrichota bacterium]MCB9475216.1 PorV/PorQ family protein [Candidatus Delongbacteria bacterium]